MLNKSHNPTPPPRTVSPKFSPHPHAWTQKISRKRNLQVLHLLRAVIWPKASIVWSGEGRVVDPMGGFQGWSSWNTFVSNIYSNNLKTWKCSATWNIFGLWFFFQKKTHKEKQKQKHFSCVCVCVLFFSRQNQQKTQAFFFVFVFFRKNHKKHNNSRMSFALKEGSKTTLNWCFDSTWSHQVELETLGLDSWKARCANFPWGFSTFQTKKW